MRARDVGRARLLPSRAQADVRLGRSLALPIARRPDCSPCRNAILNYGLIVWRPLVRIGSCGLTLDERFQPLEAVADPDS